MQLFGRHFIVTSNYGAKASGSHISVARDGLGGSNCPKKVAGGLLNRATSLQRSSLLFLLLLLHQVGGNVSLSLFLLSWLANLSKIVFYIWSFSDNFPFHFHSNLPKGPASRQRWGQYFLVKKKKKGGNMSVDSYTIVTGTESLSICVFASIPAIDPKTKTRSSQRPTSTKTDTYHNQRFSSGTQQ